MEISKLNTVVEYVVLNMAVQVLSEVCSEIVLGAITKLIKLILNCFFVLRELSWEKKLL